jgi:hypothetical protein
MHRINQRCGERQRVTTAYQRTFTEYIIVGGRMKMQPPAATGCSPRRNSSTAEQLRPRRWRTVPTYASGDRLTLDDSGGQGRVVEARGRTGNQHERRRLPPIPDHVRPFRAPPRCRGIGMGDADYTDCAYGYRDLPPFIGPCDCPVCNGSGIEGGYARQ